MQAVCRASAGACEHGSQIKGVVEAARDATGDFAMLKQERDCEIETSVAVLGACYALGIVVCLAALVG